MPRLRLRLAHVMVIVLIFALLNALVAVTERWVHTAEPPHVRRARVVDLFLLVNLIAGLLTGFMVFMTWAVRAHWYRRAGGLIPFPKQNPLMVVVGKWRWPIRLALAAAWLAVAFLGGVLLGWGGLRAATSLVP